MSFAVFQQATRSQAIDACLFAPFTSAEASNLILCKGDHLEVYDVEGSKQHRLVFSLLVPLFGRPDALATYRPSAGSRENLAVLFRRGSYLSVLRYEPELGGVRTVGQHALVPPGDPAASAAAVEFRPQVSVDPEHRCLACRVLPDRVLVFPVSAEADWRRDAGPAVHEHDGMAFHQDPGQRPGLAAPFSFTAWAPLRLHHLEDVRLLHGYHQPTAACLGQSKPGWGGSLCESNTDNSDILIVTFSLAEKVAHVVWACRGLPHDLFQVVPLQVPLGGLLALANNAVFYIKEHSISFCQTLNKNTTLGGEFSRQDMHVKDETALGIVLAGSCAVVLSPTVVLISVQPTGRLWLAHLVHTTRDVVDDIVWTCPGTGAPVLDLCAAREELLFLAAADRGTLLQMSASKKKRPKDPREPEKKAARTQEPGDDKENEQEGNEGEEGRAPAEPAEPSEALKALLATHASLRDSSKSIRSYNFAVADELPSLGAVRCLQLWGDKPSGEEDDEPEAASPCGTQRFACCSGVGVRGALHIFQRAVPLESLTEFELPAGPKYSAAWSIHQPVEEPVIADAGVSPGLGAKSGDKRAFAEGPGASAGAEASSEVPTPHRFVLVSGSAGSMVLEATQEIEEITKSTPLDSQACTVAAGSVLRGKAVIQVTKERLCCMWAGSPKVTEGLPEPVVFSQLAVKASAAQAAVQAQAEAEQEGAAPPQPGGMLALEDSTPVAPPHACSGCVCDPFVAVRFLPDQRLRLFRISEALRVEEISDKLPEDAVRPVLCASIFRGRVHGHSEPQLLLVVLTPAKRGTLQIIDLRDMRQVFRTAHVADVPPVLRAHRGQQDDGPELDHMRSLTDVCAPLPRSVTDAAGAKAAQQQRPQAGFLAACCELVEVDGEDRGPTLVVMLVGRPVLLYRSCMLQSAEEAETTGGAGFPYHFALWEHGHVGIVESGPVGPYHAVAPFRHASGTPSGAHRGVIVVPPHAGIPGLWLTALQNRLFVHPLPGTHTRALVPLHAPCCEGGFFALAQPEEGGPVTAQVHALGTAEGLPDGQNGFELRCPVPTARRLLQRTPHCLAVSPQDGVVAIAVSDSVEEAPDAPAGPSPDDDPLSEDWGIVKVPPVEAEPPPVPRLQPRYELWIDNIKNVGRLGRYRFSFDPDEHVLSLAWVRLAGLPSPALAVGTGANTGEDLTCRGRVLIFSTKDREPGIVPAMYQRSIKAPVTVVGQWGEYFVHSEGYKLFFERWEKENGNFNKVAHFDGQMCLTSMSMIKNFLLCGDLRKGVDFVQWKEEAPAQTRTLRRLSRSPPLMFMTVLACDFIVCQKSLGMVALDSSGSAHLFQYTPHSDGREGDQLLRSCATFKMGFPVRATLRLQTEPGVQCLFMASVTGELLCLRPIDDQVYRTVTTLLGIMSTRLPFCGGLNPRAFRAHEDSRQRLVAPRKNIEDAVLIRAFYFLSAPLQANVAERMRMPVAALAKAIMPGAADQLFALKPEPPPGAAVTALATR